MQGGQEGTRGGGGAFLDFMFMGDEGEDNGSLEAAKPATTREPPMTPHTAPVRPSFNGGSDRQLLHTGEYTSTVGTHSPFTEPPHTHSSLSMTAEQAQERGPLIGARGHHRPPASSQHSAVGR